MPTKKLALFTLILLNFSLFATAQMQEDVAYVDSLKKVQESNYTDSVQFVIYAATSAMYRNTEPDSSLYYARTLSLFENKNKNKLPGEMEPVVLDILGWALWTAGNYPDARATFIRLLEYGEKSGDTGAVVAGYRGIGVVYRNEGNFKEAIKNFQRSNSFVSTKEMDDSYLQNVIDIGKAYEQMDVLDSALQYTQLGYQFGVKQYQGKGNGGIEANLGSIQSKMGNAAIAVAYFEKSIEKSRSVNDDRTIARCYYEWAKHFDRNKQTDSAINYATRAININLHNTFLIQTLASSELLTQLYRQQNKIDSAFKYQSIMLETRDSMFSREKINRLQSLEFNEQLRQQEIELAKEKAAEERKHNLQLLAIAIFIVTFFVSFLVLSKIKVRPRVVEFMGIVALLLVFEFIALLMHPLIEAVTHHSPIFMLALLAMLAAILAPLHHNLNEWVKARLAQKEKIMPDDEESKEVTQID